MKASRTFNFAILFSLAFLSLGDDTASGTADLIKEVDEVKPEATEQQAPATLDPVKEVDEVKTEATEQQVPVTLDHDASDSNINGQESIDSNSDTSEKAPDSTINDDGSSPTGGNLTGGQEASEKETADGELKEAPVQTGPFIDLLGESLLSLEMIDEKQAQLNAHYTNEALSGKKVVGLYFSADWCGPCRQFTPDLVNFYNKMNSRRGRENEFEIVWISRCRDFDSFGQYFTHMNWLAMPPQEAMGKRGEMLSEKYKVKGIPSLVLLDEVGNVITTDARNKIPMDKAGIGFPWRNPLSTIYSTLLPKSLRLMLKSQLDQVKENMLKKIKGAIRTTTAKA